jgi:Tfp pilus assembly protein FimT
MKKNQGSTLIELAVGLSASVILAASLGFYFQSWTDACRMEGEVKEMYVDFLRARARALERNRKHFFVAKNNGYQIYEDTNDNGQYDADADKIAFFTSPKTPAMSYSWKGVFTIDTNGLARADSGLSETIRFDSGSKNLDRDCIVVWATRINMGKWDGEQCVAK